jgi:hypothetical protein
MRNSFNTGLDGQMIDYEKLKLAHELADKIPDNCFVTHHWANHTTSSLDYFRFHYGRNGNFEDFENIDCLITKLQELTHPEPKYKVDERACSLKRRGQSGFMQGFVKRYDPMLDIYYVKYDGEGAYWQKEESLYPSNEALIDAQIAYWKSQRKSFDDEYGEIKFNLPLRFSSPASPPFEGEIIGFNHIKICEHEPDDRTWGAATEIDFSKHKCTKCGEFYKCT